MKDTLIIGAAIVVALALGAWLVLSEARQTAPMGPVAFSVLDEGSYSGTITERKNYRVKTQEQLQMLWQMVKGEDAPVIDFDKQEVLAIFDGTRSSGGYAVEVASVVDGEDGRSVTVRRTEPGDSCMTTDAITSPYVIVVLTKGVGGISHENVVETKECN